MNLNILVNKIESCEYHSYKKTPIDSIKLYKADGIVEELTKQLFDSVKIEFKKEK